MTPPHKEPTQAEVGLAEEILAIRNQLWVESDKFPLTVRQRGDIEIIKNRLWRLYDRLTANENGEST